MVQSCPKCKNSADEEELFCGKCGFPLVRRTHYAELKSVAILFADVKGFTGLAEELEPDHTADVINRCFRVLDGAVYRYGGIVDKHLGDGLMALFGAPVAVERAAERAVLAGLAMQEGIQALSSTFFERAGAPLSLRVGIDLGTVYFGEVGSTGEVSAIGDVVNRAERIEEACPPGDVLVNEPLKDVTSSFKYAPLGEVQLRGREGASKVWRVTGILDPGIRWETIGSSELAGRDGEFRKVARYLERAVSGERVVVGVVGATGYGKSTAAAQAVRRAELAGMRAFLCECNPYTKSVPYHPFRPAFAKVLGVTLPPERELIHEKAKELFPELAPAGDWLTLLFMADGPSFTGAVDRGEREQKEQIYNVREIAARLLENDADEGLLLVIDDFDWSDQATIDFLSHLKARKNGGVCVFLTAGSSDALSKTECDEVIELGPLGRGALREIIHEAYPGMEDEAVAAVAERAAGNPLFAVELARSTSRGEPIPESIKLLVQVRLDNLEPNERDFLRAAAVLGPDVKTELLNKVLGFADDVPAIIDRLAGDGFIKMREDTVSFANKLVHDITCGTIVRDEREFTANRASAFLDEVYQPESLDWLMRRATCSELTGRRAEAGGCYAKLGSLANESLSFEEAERYFGRAVKHFRDEPEYRPIRVITQAERARNLVDADEYEKARALLQDEFREDDPANLKAAVVMGIGRCYYHEGQYKEALVYYEDADHLLRKFEDYEARAELAHLRAVALYHLGRFAGAIGNAEIALGTQRTLGDKGREAAALNLLGVINMSLRRLDTATKHFNAALDLWRDVNDRFGISKTYLNLGVINLLLGRYEQAEELTKESLGIAEEMGSRWGILRAEGALARIYINVARFKEAEGRAERALVFAREINDLNIECGVLINLARISTQTKEFGKASEYCTDAYDLAVKMGDKMRIWDSLLYWATLLADMPEVPEEEFRRKLEDLREAAYLPDHWETIDTLEVDWALAAGRPRDALSALDEIEKKYPDMGDSTRRFVKFHRGVALLEIGELDAAEEELLGRYNDRSGVIFPKVLAAYYLARLYCFKRDHDKASRYHAEAEKGFEAVGGDYWPGLCEKLTAKVAAVKT
jgi:class 3 adenylate cyclase/tetratricopeptide (TPR) repeat protein